MVVSLLTRFTNTPVLGAFAKVTLNVVEPPGAMVTVAGTMMSNED